MVDDHLEDHCDCRDPRDILCPVGIGLKEVEGKVGASDSHRLVGGDRKKSSEVDQVGFL